MNKSVNYFGRLLISGEAFVRYEIKYLTGARTGYILIFRFQNGGETMICLCRTVTRYLVFLQVTDQKQAS